MKEKSTKVLFHTIGLILIIIGFLWFLKKISWAIKIFVISLLIVYVLFPISEYFKKRLRLSHLASVGLTFIFFLLVIASLLSLVIPVVQREIQEILRDFPFYMGQLQRYMEEFAELMSYFNLSADLVDPFPQLSTNLQPLLEELASLSVSLVSSLVDIFFIIFLVFYLLYDFQNVREAALSMVPPLYKQTAQDIMVIMDRNFGGYIRGNIIRCGIVGLLTGFILFAMGMPYSLLLGILAGALNIILYLGPYIAAIPAVLLSFSPHTPSTVAVLAVYVFVQGVDGILLSPLLLGRAVKLKPITVIACLLIGQQLAGILGMILSTPLAGIIKSLLEYFREKKSSPAG